MESGNRHHGGSTDDLTKAKSKTSDVKDELEVAGAELHLANSALDRNLPAQEPKGDVKKALRQGEVIEAKIVRAAEDLDDVKELLSKEITQKRQLQAELRQARTAR